MLSVILALYGRKIFRPSNLHICIDNMLRACGASHIARQHLRYDYKTKGEQHGSQRRGSDRAGFRSSEKPNASSTHRCTKTRRESRDQNR